MTVPTRTSSRLSSPATWIRYSGAIVNASVETVAAVAAMVRNTRSGRAMSTSDERAGQLQDQRQAFMAGHRTAPVVGPGP